MIPEHLEQDFYRNDQTGFQGAGVQGAGESGGW